MKHLIYLFATLLCINITFKASAQGSLSDISAILEKKSDPSNPVLKMRASLLELEEEYLMALKEGVSPDNFSSSQDLVMVKNGQVRIEASAKKSGPVLVEALAQLGAEEIDSYQRIVNAWIPIDQISQLPLISELLFVKPVYWVSPDIGSVTSEADSALQSAIIRRNYCLDGSGVRIGVLSDSYNLNSGEAAAIATGDLPGVGNPNGYTTPVNVVNEGGGGIDEGRAMIELIHDMAPGAQIFFNTALGGQATYATAILNLASVNNCDVIVDDVRLFDEPFYMDGLIAQACDAVFTSGVPYFASAGNYAQSSYEAPYNDTQGSFNAHDFNTGAGVDTLQSFSVSGGSPINLILQWDDPWGSQTSNSAATDLDIWLYNSAGTLVASSSNSNIGNDPVEFIGYTDPNGPGTYNYRILITRFAGPAPSAVKWVIRNAQNLNILEYPPATNNARATGYGHSNAFGANAVGAAFWANTPAYGVNPPIPEGFTSSGGVQIRYNTSGNAIAPITRNKPNFSAVDGVSNTFFGNNNNFFGTSAAAPNAAALAVLMLEADATLTPTQIRSFLNSSCIDMNAPGFDFITGLGLVQGVPAIQSVYNGICNISDITVQSGPTCTPNVVGAYSVTLKVSFSNAPCVDTLVVNGQKFPVTGTNSQNVTLTGLNADGNGVNVTATFVNSPGCSLTKLNLFTAPEAPSGTSGTEAPVCSDTPFFINLQSKINNNVLSSFTWTVNYNGMTGGNGPCNSGCANAIFETIENDQLGTRDAIYTVTPTSGAGCQGSDFTVTQPVWKEPKGSNGTEAGTCSGDQFNIDLQSYITNSTPSSFTWTAFYNGLIGGAGAGATGNTLTETLINPSHTQIIEAEYTVTPKSDAHGCVGDAYLVKKPIFPRPPKLAPFQCPIVNPGCDMIRIFYCQDDLSPPPAGDWIRGPIATNANYQGMPPMPAPNTLKWYANVGGNPGPVVAEPTPNTANPNVTFYHVSQVNVYGCESPTIMVRIEVRPAPLLSAQPLNIICEGSSIDLVWLARDLRLEAATFYYYDQDPSGGGIVPFDTAQTLGGHIAGHEHVVVTPPATKTYWVTAVKPYFYPPNCWDTVQVIVNVDPVPTLTPTADQVVAVGSNVGINFSSAPAGSAIWNNSNPGIGLGYSGFGNLNFTAQNPTAGPMVSQVIVNALVGVCVSEPDTFNITVNPAGPIAPLLAARVGLQGPMDTLTGLMRSELGPQNLIPALEPYTGLGYTHVGGGGEGSNIQALPLTGSPDAIVDWVVLELRDALDPKIIVATRSALLQQDGDIVEIDGVSPVAFPGLAAGNYHVAVRHRNHLGIMAAQTITLGATTAQIDFSLPTTQIYGGAAGVNVIGGKQVLISGDSDNDGQIQNTDLVNYWFNQAGSSGYSESDYNLDGQIQNSDQVYYWVPNAGKGSLLPK